MLVVPKMAHPGQALRPPAAMQSGSPPISIASMANSPTALYLTGGVNQSATYLASFMILREQDISGSNVAVHKPLLGKVEEA